MNLERWSVLVILPSTLALFFGFKKTSVIPPTIFRIQAQFDHLAETYFDGFEFDLGEKELGYAVSFDLDLDMFSASIALAKTCVATILDDEGQSGFILEMFSC